MLKSCDTAKNVLTDGQSFLKIKVSQIAFLRHNSE